MLEPAIRELASTGLDRREFGIDDGWDDNPISSDRVVVENVPDRRRTERP